MEEVLVTVALTERGQHWEPSQAGGPAQQQLPAPARHEKQRMEEVLVTVGITERCKCEPGPDGRGNC
jgi:hypothetical protein